MLGSITFRGSDDSGANISNLMTIGESQVNTDLTITFGTYAGEVMARVYGPFENTGDGSTGMTNYEPIVETAGQAVAKLYGANYQDALITVKAKMRPTQ